MDAPGNPEPAGPSSAGNPAGTGPEGSITTPPPTTGATPPATGDYQQLQGKLQELEALNQRYRANMDGSKQEVERTKAELDTLRQEMQQFNEWRQRAAQVIGGQPQGPDPNLPLTADRAFDQYWSWKADSGQPHPLSTWEQQFLERNANFTLQKLQNAMLPAQRASWLEQRYKDELDTSKSMFKDVMAEYEAIMADPVNRGLYPEDPQYAMQLDPRTGQQRTVDLRAMNEAILRYRARQGAQAQQSQEQAQQSRPTVEGKDAGSQSAPPPADEALLYDDEIINSPSVREAMQSAGRGSDPRTLKKFYWDHMPPAEKKKRQAMRDAGQWTGKRS